LLAHQIDVQHMVIVGAPSYLARRAVPRSWADLAAHDCIVERRQGNRIGWLMKQPDGSTARQTVPVLMAARAGHGLTQLPSWMVQDDIRFCALTGCCKSRVWV
jgi:DNA-binding transcriptional LysR family regulator